MNNAVGTIATLTQGFCYRIYLHDIVVIIDSMKIKCLKSDASVKDPHSPRASYSG